MRPTPSETITEVREGYEPPKLFEIGGVYELTLSGCFLDKKWGGSDGLHFMGMPVPVSSC
jgi:hypothetical protein